MKTQICNRILDVRTALLLAVSIGFGLATMTPAAGNELTATTPIRAYSKVLKSVEQRSDFGVLEMVHYDTELRAWNFLYTKIDGLQTVVMIDAVTGEQVTKLGALKE